MTRGVRRAGRDEERKRELPMQDEGTSMYAKVIQLLGNNRMKLLCRDGKERLGIIRGAMKKREWISRDDIVLVTKREFEEDKVDIIFRYTNTEVSLLARMQEPVRFKDENDDQDHGDVVFEDDDIDMNRI